MIPPRGPIPREVGDAPRHLKPTAITVVGSEHTLPTEQVRRLVGTTKFARNSQDDPTKRGFDHAVDMGTINEHTESEHILR